MNYKLTKIGRKRFTEEERQTLLKQLRKGIKKTSEKMAKSPCYYRGCELWSDCRKCNGFMEGCTARLPELLLKDEYGNWRRSDP